MKKLRYVGQLVAAILLCLALAFCINEIAAGRQNDNQGNSPWRASAIGRVCPVSPARTRVDGSLPQRGPFTKSKLIPADESLWEICAISVSPSSQTINVGGSGEVYVSNVDECKKDSHCGPCLNYCGSLSGPLPESWPVTFCTSNGSVARLADGNTCDYNWSSGDNYEGVGSGTASALVTVEEPDSGCSANASATITVQ